MDAVEFLKTLCRMCNCECCNCEFKKRLSVFEACTAWRKTHPEEAVAIVERWAVAHPVKTRQSVFLERYPEARIGDDGVLKINPCFLSASHRNVRGNCATMGRECSDCRREFWLAEVEDA